MKFLVAFVVLLLSMVQGLPSERIAGGSVVSISQYPFAAALLSNSGEGEYSQVCGGSILTTTALLSAASCFHSNGIQNPVEWWQTRVGSSEANSGGAVYSIRLITPHPNFNTATLDNDIAVLRTASSIIFSPGIVEAAYIPGSLYTLERNQRVWAIGWGAISDLVSSEELREVQIWVIDQNICSQRHSEVNFAVTSNMVCAGWLDVGVRGQCVGDNGSPLLDNGVVVGVHSSSESCASWRYPSINTLVAPYTQWIIAFATA